MDQLNLVHWATDMPPEVGGHGQVGVAYWAPVGTAFSGRRGFRGFAFGLTFLGPDAHPAQRSDTIPV
ncbi:hypothetical protein Y1Q_0007766 [Alligator mississippiensis]|uniref:Uncharacterized protein n=1 Tax=Alligator mississippiensis TaxID=8496 RepID=A0A151N7R6_ALLMI|nr:hypothetical protein Y1Q_0007766 [Alligator mississippiensis]